MHFADRLLAACEDKGAPVCAGIDPVFERLPRDLRGDAAGPRDAPHAVEAIGRFVRGVLEAVRPHVPCVKLQSACFERYHWRGVKLYDDMVREARAMGLIVIGDAKRGDIGISAAHYAAGCLADDVDAPGPDALTVNGYLGGDSLEPLIDVAAAQGKGLFALVRTSNPGGDALQGLKLDDGRSVGEAVADLVAQQGEAHVGERGYSLLGAVVGATKPADAASLRRHMPRQIFLVPGFGAQGGGADDVRACFKADGTGAIITASRSVNYAFEKAPEADWKQAIEAAALDLRQQIRGILRR